jgi:NitT/TauT family transport system substrate-binding protein
MVVVVIFRLKIIGPKLIFESSKGMVPIFFTFKTSPLFFCMRITILLLSVIFNGCSNQESAETADEVTVQLKWLHQAQFAGFYVAIDKGYYEQENLKVNILEGGEDIDNAVPLLSGQADFSVLAPENILIKRSHGDPITAIAVFYRQSAVVFLSITDSGITHPSHFVGKTVAVAGKEGIVRDFENQFYSLMKMFGLDISKVKVVEYDPDYTGFLKGEVDVTAAYWTGSLIKLREKGYNPNIIWPGDFGVHFYSDTLATTEEKIILNPELITRFLRATLKGWQAAVGDPNAAVAATLKYVQIPDLKLQTAMMESQLPLVHTGQDQIGWMQENIWKEMHQVLLEHGMIGAPLDIEKVYTMSFLKSFYGEVNK